MTYYKDTDYKEHYYTEFKDREGGLWHVSIQDPTFTGQATELTAAGNPLEWMGSGDGKQDECILGSTGYLRLMCKNSTEANIFNLAGNLRPSSVNDRRVIATRNSVIMWAGYIACEDYSQSWESAPYEVELPLVSMLAVAEKFTMPKFGTQEEVTDIAGLLRYVARLLAVPGSETDSTYAHGQFATNNPIYYDFRGQATTISGNQVHWTQGICYTSYYYDRGECFITPMTLKEVLETILYPYGHIREHGANWMIRMDAATGDATKLWTLNIETEDNRWALTDSEDIDTYALSSLNILSDGNTLSTISAPQKVTFKTTDNNTNTVFDPNGEWMSTNKEIKYDDIRSSSGIYQVDGKTYYYIGLSEDDVDCDYVEIVSKKYLKDGNPFARCIVMTKNSDDNYQFDEYMPLAFDLRRVNDGGPLYATEINFRPKVKVISLEGYSKLKITVKRLRGSQVSMQVKCDGQYLTDASIWTEAEASITKTSSEFSIVTNEPRTSGDMSPKQLDITIKHGGDSPYTGPLVHVKIEYIKDVANSTQNLEYAMNDAAEKKGNTIEVGGYGDEMNITYKTMCSRTFRADGGTAEMPHNGFCDDRLHIDTGQRKKLEIEACNVSNPTYLVRYPCIITDGDINYIPVAVGMNARDCTTQLKLVSTNI